MSRKKENTQPPIPELRDPDTHHRVKGSVVLPYGYNKYSPDMPERLIEYFNRPYVQQVEDKFGKLHNIATPPPSYVGFARMVGVATQTLDQWREKYPKFGAAYELCKDIGQQNLIDGGLTFALNPLMCKFILSAKYGMVEKTAQESSVRLEVSLPEELDEEAD